MQSAPTKNRGWVVALGVLTLSLVSGLACPGNLDPGLDTGGGSAGSGGSPPQAGCPEALDLFLTKCAIGGCHDEFGSSADLDLKSADPASRLLGVASTGGNLTKCAAGMVYLNPGSNPATGLLIDKLTNVTCGDPMPSLVTWSDANLQCVLSWANSITSPPAP